jgi:hypothetical protein
VRYRVCNRNCQKAFWKQHKKAHAIVEKAAIGVCDAGKTERKLDSPHGSEFHKCERLCKQLCAARDEAGREMEMGAELEAAQSAAMLTLPGSKRQVWALERFGTTLYEHGRMEEAVDVLFLGCDVAERLLAANAEPREVSGNKQAGVAERSGCEGGGEIKARSTNESIASDLDAVTFDAERCMDLLR